MASLTPTPTLTTTTTPKRIVVLEWNDLQLADSQCKVAKEDRLRLKRKFSSRREDLRTGFQVRDGIWYDILPKMGN
jgi:hypothetical protein